MTQLTDKERTAQMNDMRSFDEQMPCVGIFWYDPADHSFFGVRKKEITPQMVEDAAEKGSPVISYPDVRGELSADDSRLAGRVVWSIDKFIVLVGKWAEPMQEALTELLEKEFSLPYFEFVYDEHWDLSTGGRGICRDKGVDLWFDARSDSKVILDDTELPQGYPWGRHQYANGRAANYMRHRMNKNALSSFVPWLKTLVGNLENVGFENENQIARLCSTPRGVHRGFLQF